MKKNRKAIGVVAFGLLVVVGCTASQEEDDNSDTTGSAVTGGQALPHHAGIMKWHDPSELKRDSAPAGAKLKYYGGRVVSNIEVVQVLWGTGSYLNQVSSTASPSIASFYGGVTNSAYFDWLTEYNTTTTNQQIGHGTFKGQFSITPSTSAASIDDSVIQTELLAQIKAGHLPAPTSDAKGNNNTYYAIFFPHGKTITQGGSSSCQSGGFCAYHGTVKSSTSEIYYGVHPDMQAGSGCDTGCGNSTPFQNYTSVASHELVETVTDCEVGIATVVGAPLAWYDTTNGEIGDICNAQQGSVVGGDGVTYTVQTEFSNTANNCIVTKGTTPPTDAGTDAKDSGTDSGTDGGTSTCKHSECSTGAKLASACDPCVTQICAADSYCCHNKWDSVCVGEVSSICHKTCP